MIIVVGGVIENHYSNLTSQSVQYRASFFIDGSPSSYQPNPTGLNFHYMGPLVQATLLSDSIKDSIISKFNHFEILLLCCPG